MKRIALTFFLPLICVFFAASQSQTRKLPAIINHPSLNLFAPFLSADGNALIFVSDNGQEGAYMVSYTSRESDWTTPVELPKQLNNRLNFMRGYSLSADGKRIYVTSAKTPVVGGYDIFTSELKGTTWSAPENLMLPINSKSNEACPSFTPDGKTIFFMRCDKMDLMKAESCKLFMARKKSNGQWEEPVELPAFINTGNSQTPRIMADGETLIFSSDKFTPNKGGMDLYLSRYKNGSWSQPVPLDFVNSERDDQYVSVSALGRYLLKEAKGNRGNFELTEFLLPSTLRPRGLTKVEGKVSGIDGAAVASYISVTDVGSNKRIYSSQPAADGTFQVYLPEGSLYELSIDPDQADLRYFAKLFDLRSEKIPQKEKVNAVLKKLLAGDEIALDLVSFKPYSVQLEAIAEEELKRFARIVKANPEKKFEITLLQEGVVEDSVQSSPELTEVKSDTIRLTMIDDSTAVETVVENIKTTYHNDRTLRQTEALNDFLAKEGVLPRQIAIVRRAVPGPLAEQRLKVSATVK
jgi:hypothetical protein